MSGEERTLTTVDASLPVPIVTLEQWAARRSLFNEWVNKQLREDTDFGRIPGTDRPTLLKPGAEKILQFYGCAPLLEAVQRQQDPSTGYLYIEFIARAASVQTGQIIGTGVGACSSYESRYRYRWEWWNDGKSKPDPTAGWEQTRGGKWRRRTENRDLIDTWNTVLKIAKKRALVDLALTISGASEKFTQDVEDAEEPPPATEPPAPESSAAPPKSAPAPKPAEHQPASNGDAKLLRPLAPEKVREVLGKKISRMKELTGKQPSDGMRGLLVGRMAEAIGGSEEQQTQGRHLALEYLLGVLSSKDLDAAQTQSLLSWLQGATAEERAWANQELQQIVAARLVAMGQEQLL